MAEYIQSNNDSGNLALYAGVGLAGAAGGAALAYRFSRDPSNGKTAATGKLLAGDTAKSVAEEVAATTISTPTASAPSTGKKMGFMSKLLGGGTVAQSATQPRSTIPASDLITGVDLGGVTSTPAVGNGIELPDNFAGRSTTGTKMPQLGSESSISVDELAANNRGNVKQRGFLGRQQNVRPTKTNLDAADLQISSHSLNTGLDLTSVTGSTASTSTATPVKKKTRLGRGSRLKGFLR